MFSKNLKDYQDKLEKVKKRFMHIQYICSPQLEGYILGIPGYVLQKTKIKQGDIFEVSEFRGFNYVDIKTNYLETYQNIPTTVLDTCPQVSYHEPKVGDRFIRVGIVWEIYEIDGYDGDIKARSEIGPIRLDAYQLKDDTQWVG